MALSPALVDSAPAEPHHRRVFVLGRKVVSGLFTHHAFDHAATMAFYFFLGSIPLLVFAGLLVGGIVQREGAEELAAPFYRAMPRAAADLLRHELRAIGDAEGVSIAPLSIGGFLWLTSNGVHNLMDVFELLIGARPRPWWRQRLIATVWVVAGLAVIAGATWLLLLLNGAASGIETHHWPRVLKQVSDFLAAGWQRIGVLIVFVAIVSCGLALFYRTAVQHPRVIRRHVWPGTFVALILWTLVSWAFGRYVTTLGHYAVFYGSLATVAVILLWLYLTSLSLLVGAEVNAQVEGVRELRLHEHVREHEAASKRPAATPRSGLPRGPIRPIDLVSVIADGLETSNDAGGRLMGLHIGSIAPDFTQDSTEGRIHFYEWLGDSWGVLFSHPKDFTPVCTTELGAAAKLKPEFEKRNVKIAALSVDGLDSHKKWVSDIEETQKTTVNYPIFADADRTISKLYDMIHPEANDTLTVRSVFVIDGKKKIRATFTYPASTGRNFEEILRLIDSLQLTDSHAVATPANWKDGGDVVIVPSLQDPAEIQKRFPKGFEAVRPYLRITPQPNR